MFQELNLFPSSGEGERSTYSLWFRRKNLNHGFFLLSEDGNRSSFRNVVLSRLRLKGFVYATIFVVYTIILYSLHVSVVRPSSGGHIYIAN
jgi:hypothetical protein